MGYYFRICLKVYVEAIKWVIVRVNCVADVFS